MIITRTPFRISFTGGGTDLQEYYRHQPGCVISTSINKYVYLSLHPYFFKDGFLLKYSQHEAVHDVSQIQHNILRTVFTDYGIKGIDFNSSADVPAGTGLGSSSAFTVGLAHLCNAYKGQYLSKEAMAAYACQVEIEKLASPIGKQDQYACAIGDLNMLTFYPDETVTMEKLCLSHDAMQSLNRNLLMFYTGTSRSANDILAMQKQNTVSDPARLKTLGQMAALTHTLRDELLGNNIDALGEILHENWMLKKTMATAISTPDIDYYYELARKNGALGGKLLGAGGGGFLLLYVKEENQAALRKALGDLNELSFEFDRIGTTVIYHS
jgi:D-glycero-alpha-D-manno-heptose-7-phosphate kinase